MKKLLSISAFFMVLSLVVMGLGNSAVQAVAGTPAATDDKAMVATMAATPSNIDLVPLQLQIVPGYATDKADKPKYSIKVTKPVLAGPASKDKVAVNFNKAVDDLVTKLIKGFKDEFSQVQSNATLPPEIAALESFAEVKYSVLTADKGILSIKFDVFYYYAGAAHPNSYSMPLNYDLNNAKVLTLAGLFKPNAKYLDVLSQYCTKALQDAGTLEFPEGALPKEDNYRNWFITAKGLQITFDSYQVMPYVAGPQQVFVPYAELKDIIADKSALQPFASSVPQAANG